MTMVYTPPPAVGGGSPNPDDKSQQYEAERQAATQEQEQARQAASQQFENDKSNAQQERQRMLDAAREEYNRAVEQARSISSDNPEEQDSIKQQRDQALADAKAKYEQAQQQAEDQYQQAVQQAQQSLDTAVQQADQNAQVKLQDIDSREKQDQQIAPPEQQPSPTGDTPPGETPSGEMPQPPTLEQLKNNALGNPIGKMGGTVVTPTPPPTGQDVTDTTDLDNDGIADILQLHDSVVKSGVPGRIGPQGVPYTPPASVRNTNLGDIGELSTQGPDQAPGALNPTASPVVEQVVDTAADRLLDRIGAPSPAQQTMDRQAADERARLDALQAEQRKIDPTLAASLNTYAPPQVTEQPLAPPGQQAPRSPAEAVMQRQMAGEQQRTQQLDAVQRDVFTQGQGVTSGGYAPPAPTSPFPATDPFLGAGNGAATRAPAPSGAVPAMGGTPAAVAPAAPAATTPPLTQGVTSEQVNDRLYEQPGAGWVLQPGDGSPTRLVNSDTAIGMVKRGALALGPSGVSLMQTAGVDPRQIAQQQNAVTEQRGGRSDVLTGPGRTAAEQNDLVNRIPQTEQERIDRAWVDHMDVQYLPDGSVGHTAKNAITNEERTVIDRRPGEPIEKTLLGNESGVTPRMAELNQQRGGGLANAPVRQDAGPLLPADTQSPEVYDNVQRVYGPLYADVGTDVGGGATVAPRPTAMNEVVATDPNSPAEIAAPRHPNYDPVLQNPNFGFTRYVNPNEADHWKVSTVLDQSLNMLDAERAKGNVPIREIEDGERLATADAIASLARGDDKGKWAFDPLYDAARVAWVREQGDTRIDPKFADPGYQARWVNSFLEGHEELPMQKELAEDLRRLGKPAPSDIAAARNGPVWLGKFGKDLGAGVQMSAISPEKQIAVPQTVEMAAKYGIDRGLTYNICGPIAINAMLRGAKGDDSTPLDQVWRTAVDKGYWRNGAWTGPVSFGRMLNKVYGQNAEIFSQTRWNPGDLGDMAEKTHMGLSQRDVQQAMVDDVSQGKPVAMSTTNHYFVATDYRPDDDRFYVGTTGTAYASGKTWMSIREMKSIAGDGPNDTAFSAIRLSGDVTAAQRGRPLRSVEPRLVTAMGDEPIRPLETPAQTPEEPSPYRTVSVAPGGAAPGADVYNTIVPGVQHDQVRDSLANVNLWGTNQAPRYQMADVVGGMTQEQRQDMFERSMDKGLADEGLKGQDAEYWKDAMRRVVLGTGEKFHGENPFLNPYIIAGESNSARGSANKANSSALGYFQFLSQNPNGSDYGHKRYLPEGAKPGDEYNPVMQVRQFVRAINQSRKYQGDPMGVVRDKRATGVWGP